MTKIGKLWTGGVAYVSLMVGAGLSVAGNLADTYRTRGEDIDALDKVMAAGWPILVLLAIEMFVSPRWSDKRLFQVWRWTGCLSVGGMAMVVSWTHLHDLMDVRGQLPVVAILGPLAIDGMAIMATGLILSTRTRMMSADKPATDADGQGRTDADTWTPIVATDTDGQGRTDADTWTPIVATDTDGQGRTVVAVSAPTPLPDGWVSTDMRPVAFSTADMDMDMDMDPVATRPDGELDAWTAGYEDALSTLGQELADETERYVSTSVTDTLPRRTRTSGGVSFPDEFGDMVIAWTRAGRQISRADMIKQSAAHFGVHPRTVRRWMSACTGE